MHRHKDRNIYKHENVKLIKQNLSKTSSILIRFDCLFTINKINKTHSDITNINE